MKRVSLLLAAALAFDGGAASTSWAQAGGNIVSPLPSSCVSRFADASNYNYLSFRNDCGQGINITWVSYNRGTTGSGGLDTPPGGIVRTGIQPRNMAIDGGGFSMYICPAGYVPIDPAGNTVRGEPNVDYRCARNI